MDDQGLPPSALRMMAAHLEDLARQYRARAATLDQWADNERRANQLIDRAAASPAIVRRHMKDGLSWEDAIAATATETALPIETIQHYWRRQNRADPRAEAQARAMEVMRLAARGYSNAAIGQKLSLHPNSVSRIIGKTTRAG